MLCMMMVRVTHQVSSLVSGFCFCLQPVQMLLAGSQVSIMRNHTGFCS